MVTKKGAGEETGTDSDNGKQAVLLIHGIGEQRPMETLRSFVKAVWTDDEKVRTRYVPSEVWSKPDRISRSFELRRLTTAQNRNGVRTDFFEFYWAHLMHGTTLMHVFAWIRFLLFRNPFKIPETLRGVYLLLVVGLVLIAVFALNAALPEGAQYLGTMPSWLSALISLALIPGLGGLLKNVLGDAARYLYPAPANIQRRHEIRTAGIQLIRNLHRRGYRRIVVVGHSLGSVIGYDILTHAFPDFNEEHGEPDRPQTKALDHLESLASDARHGPLHSDDVQKAQRAYLKEMAANGNAWRVTDFVTLGSPLAHAEILLAQDNDELRAKQTCRELPTCLPTLEKKTIRKVEHWRFSFDRSYEKPGRRRRGKIRVPHHAAVFGPTRWTNLYFPVRNLIWGDLIAGPVSPAFGPGIRDEEVSTTLRGGMLSHTLYWRTSPRQPNPPHVLKLREALDLADDRGA